jgi:hypothetical protein
LNNTLPFGTVAAFFLLPPPSLLCEKNLSGDDDAHRVLPDQDSQLTGNASSRRDNLARSNFQTKLHQS